MDRVSPNQTLEQPNDLAHRIIFCTYWLYFYGFRGVFGGIRVFDYIGMSLVVLGLALLVATKRLNLRIVMWVTALLCPLFIAIVLEPSIYVILFVFKTYLLALYFASYFKSMRLTIVEFVCFAIPVVVSMYYFVNPRPSQELEFLQVRMSGIDEPNFTSLSLIQAMCGAFGVYVLTEIKRAKLTAIMTILACFCGVILTASRAGVIAALFALCIFFFVKKRLYYAGGISLVAVVLVALNSNFASQHKPVVVQRFQAITGKNDLSTLTNNRNVLVEQAIDDIQHDKWLISGGPQRISEWGRYRSFNVPHNSLIDVGIAFGKASFYFYGALLAMLLVMNVWIVIAYRRYGSSKDKSTLLSAVLFLSLFPMYMSLSAGMAMSFILWMVLGAYPLLHTSKKITQVQEENSVYRYIMVYRIPTLYRYDHL